MKIVIIIDSLKGSLSSIEAGKCIKEGIERVRSDCEIIISPLADGGEGTVEALVEGMNGKYQEVSVLDPLGREILAKYGITDQLAIMEMAQASGITLVREEEKDPMVATTYGVGQMIKDAIEQGCRRFIIGIGGSATNDGGIGMLQALGFNFLDKNNEEIGFGPKEIEKLDRIDDTHKLKELDECEFMIACDVNNPLCGEKGASYVYGPQKGADEITVKELDDLLRKYAKITKKYNPDSDEDYPGVGAAGGLGFAFYNFLNGKLESGIDLILDELGIEEEIKDCDLVITGEGQLDFQTSMGKAPIGVAKLAKKYDKKVIAFAGGVTKDARECNNKGIDAYFPIVRGVTSLEEALNKENAANNMIDSVEQVFRLIQICE